MKDERQSEISGIAESRLEPGLLWGINDSGNGSTLFGFNPDGTPRAAVTVTGATNTDWEDLAAFRDEQGQAWLAIGDVGDNFSWRTYASIYLVPEPPRGAERSAMAREIRFVWSDGPRDCESLAVDLPNRRFLLLDKSRTPVGLYELPMDGEAVRRVARRIADVPTLWPGAKPLVEPIGADRYRGTPTAMDLSSDGRRLLILTYTHIALFERQNGEDWPQALQRQPTIVRLPKAKLFEAVGFSRDGTRAWAVTEGIGAPVYEWIGLPKAP